MLKIIKGIIDRRILVNFRLDPDCVARILPEPFRPRLFHGHALGGICLIRFKKMRPTWLPGFLGTASENGTHRFCVEWEKDGKISTGIYVKQRFTDSRLHEFGGDKVFPGSLSLSRFSVEEGDGKYRVSFQSAEGEEVDVSVEDATDFPKDSLFSDINEASTYFERDNVGYAPRKSRPGEFQGVKLNTTNWEVSPLKVLKAKSSLFTNPDHFPVGAAELDHSLLMSNIKHDWEVVDDICCGNLCVGQ